MIYFARRHPNNECVTNIKVGAVYPPVGENVTVLRFTDKAAGTPLAALTPISHDDNADCDVMATIDHANVLKAYGADEMTDDLIEKAAMRLEHLVMLSYAEPIKKKTYFY